MLQEARGGRPCASHDLRSRRLSRADPSACPVQVPAPVPCRSETDVQGPEPEGFGLGYNGRSMSSACRPAPASWSCAAVSLSGGPDLSRETDRVAGGADWDRYFPFFLQGGFSLEHDEMCCLMIAQ